MHYIGKSKISPLYSKGRIIYPQIRLPQRYNDVIGETAHIFETENNGEQAFLIVVGKDDKIEPVAMEIGQKVLKPDSKIAQPETETSIESRLSALESKIDKLIELNFQNNELSNNKSLKNDGLDRIRTGDLRRVKAMS